MRLQGSESVTFAVRDKTCGTPWGIPQAPAIYGEEPRYLALNASLAKDWDDALGEVRHFVRVNSGESVLFVFLI